MSRIASEIWIDGALDASNDLPWIINSASAQDAQIMGNGNSTVPGAIEELAFYDYALSQGQIQAHIAAAIPEPSTGLLLALAGVLAMGRRRRSWTWRSR